MPPQRKKAVRIGPSTLNGVLNRLRALKSSYPSSAELPTASDLRTMVDAVLWAGLRKEEGRQLSFALAYAKPGDCDDPVEFHQALDLRTETLAHLASGLVRKRSRLGVSPGPHGPHVWGITQKLPPCVKVRALSPGLVAIKYGLENVAVLESPDLHLLKSGNLRTCLRLMSEGLPTADAADLERYVLAAILLMLVEVVRRHGNGGTVLVVPRGQNKWRRSVERGYRVRYRGLKKKFEGLQADAAEQLKKRHSVFKAAIAVNDIERFLSGERVNDDLWHVLETVGQLSAVDGALVANNKLEILDFGARIKDPKHLGVAYLERRDPFAQPTRRRIKDLGGTRHRSALRFVQENRETVALVASHDGPLTLFAFDRRKHEVVAIRHVERLID